MDERVFTFDLRGRVDLVNQFLYFLSRLARELRRTKLLPISHRPIRQDLVDIFHRGMQLVARL